MKRNSFFKTILSALLLFAAVAFIGCNDDKNSSGETPDTAFINVSPETLTFDHQGAPVGSDGKFTVTSNTSWQVDVESGKNWLQLSTTTGDKDGSVTIAIPTPIATGDQAELTFTTTDTEGVKATKKVCVIQTAAPETPAPAGKLTITADFQLGATITTPELPPYTKNEAEFVTGRHEYTIEGYKFAIFVDAAEKGKFYWIDNTQFTSSLPTPNKGLFFSKLGAYIEFPAITGKVLTEASYLPTSSQNDVALDLLDAKEADVDYMLDFDDNGASVYTLISPTANTSYRIEITNKKNAQCARLVLTYNDAE